MATFEEIVAGWSSEGTVPRWPRDLGRPVEQAPSRSLAASEISDSSTPVAAAGARYGPPDPPPAPRWGMAPFIGLALLGLGVLMLAMPRILGQDSALALPLSLVFFVFGPAVLVHGQLRRISIHGS